MEIERLRKELNELLDNVVEHSSNYSDNRPIPSLEISFVLKKINKMQETLTVLKYLLERNENTNKNYSKPPLNLPKMEDDDDDWDDEDILIEPKTIVEEEAETTLENKKQGEEKATTIENLPIEKLVDAFTLNDRYLFANELFNKDMSAFNEIVKTIDNCTSFEEAKALFSSSLEQRQWDNENEHVVSFFSLIERRFM